MKNSLAILCLAVVALSPLRADDVSALAANCSSLAFDTLAEQRNIDFGLTKGATDSVVDFVSRKDDDSPSMFALFAAALEAEKSAPQQEFQALSKMAQIQASLELALEKSLVEREEERADADSALPESSPAPVPFSLSRPESFVSAGNASAGLNRLACNPAGLVSTPEPSTWALFGCGAFLLIFTLPKRQTLQPAIQNK